MQKDKLKRTFWILPESDDLIESFYRIDDCPNRSVFVERAIRFYSGYISSNKCSDYISASVNDSVERKIGNFENRMAKMLFKVSVEQALMMNIIAAYHKVDTYQIDRLRGQCVEEVKRTKGKFDFSDAMAWQHGGNQ